MADGVFTFSSQFNEFLPLYQNVIKVWIGDGINTGTAGMLYVQYENGTTAELGSVSLYATAVENGYTGTAQDWLLTIMSISDIVKGSEIQISYKVSANGTDHPSGDSGWSPTPVYEKGKFTWAKLDLKWIDRTTSSIYFVTYQGQDGEDGEDGQDGQDGQVQSVNGLTGDIVIYGDNTPISSSDDTSIKDYIDEAVVPLTATQDEIDALFSMAFFSGAAFITGRHYESGDSITYKIEALTENAPMPLEDTITVYPTAGTSIRYSFGSSYYDIMDIPEGQTSKTFEYKIYEKAHTMVGVPANPTEYVVSVTITALENGSIKIYKSENINSMYFNYEYSAAGRIVFEGGIQLNGRSMAAREFMVQIKEGDEIVADNISTAYDAAHGEMAAIAFPAINYTLKDIGVHIYTVRETSVSGNGVTISDAVYTVRLEVLDEIRDGRLEIITDGSERDINFINTYQASGTITFTGTETLVHRLFRNTDSLSISITGNGKLPSPAIRVVNLPIGEASVDFSFPTVEYTLSDMRNSLGGYDDTKTFVYSASEIIDVPGTTPDGNIHSVTVRVTDNKKGVLLVDAIYTDGEKFDFVSTYNATGSITFRGEKRLVNRNFVAADVMYAMISSSNGKLPYVTNMNVPLLVGQNITPFNFLEVTYDLSDINYEQSKTFNYIISEDTVIKGATNDTLTHSVDVYVEDNYDGTLSVVPTYSDGAKAIFESIYDATGFIALTGLKTIVNRTFKNTDVMSVSVSSNDGKLPNPATISVPLTVGSINATFSFAQITYKIVDLQNLGTKVFNYTITETITMPGTSPVSASDTVAVTVTDNCDGTLNVVPAYTNGNRATFTNVYTASADLSFKVRCIFTNGNMSTNPFSVRITQVTGNNSLTQATENVVLAAPVVGVANTGASYDVAFDNIAHFVKNSNRDDTQNTYWFLVEQIVPEVDAYSIYDNVKYDTHKKWINVSVADAYDGSLILTKSPAPELSTNLDDRFTNEQLADLTIVKAWTGDYDRLLPAEKNEFAFVITGPDDYYASFSYLNMVNDSKTIPNLSLGEYVVTEVNNTVENFIITTTYSGGTNRVNLVTGGSSISVIDNVNRQEATLNIVKVWAGDHSILTENQKNAVTFTVTGPKQKSTDATPFSRTFTYQDMTNGRMTLSQLTLGTYSVTETNYEVQYFDVDVAYTVGAESAHSVVLADADNKTITITDTYTQHVGNVKATKLFTGITAAQVPVNFSITNNYNASVFSYVNADNYATADGVTTPYEWTISNVPVRTHITFTEHDAAIADYDLEASAVPVDYTSSEVVRYQTSVVELYNNYVLHTGTVEVTKLFSGITAAQKPENFSITNSYNNSTFTYANAENRAIVDGVNGAYKWVIRNVPVHTTIEFTEHNADISDYDVATTANPANKTSAEVTKNGTSTVSLANTYTRHVGTIRITKQFSGLTAALKPGNFNITTDYDAKVFTVANVVSGDGINTPYQWDIENVPTGTVIQCTEHNTAVADYTVTETATPVSGSATSVKNTISTVAFENTYVRDTGSVKVTKQFVGLTTLPEDFYITNDYDNSVHNYANADNAATADGITIPYEWTIPNVPTGTTVEFAEHDAEVTNYTLVATALPANYTSEAVTKNNTSVVALTNTYTLQTGSVTVSKLFTGIPAELIPEDFNITNDYNEDVFILDDTDNDGDGINTACEWTIDNVPAGTEITFTENNTEVQGYELESTTSLTSDPVVADDDVQVDFVNDYVEEE